MKNRLQIKYYMPNFPYTREEAKEYIERLFATNNENARCSLPAEPIAVFYGDNLSEANVILAIGRGGDGKRLVSNLPYFTIDTAKINEDANALSEIVEDVRKVAYQAKADIVSIKEEATRAANEIVRLWEKIGNKTDGVALDTVYGYINMHVQKIMGGDVVEGLGTINTLANAIKRLRVRATNLESGLTEVKDRMTSVEEFMQKLNIDYINLSNDLKDAISAEQELRAQAHEAIRKEMADADGQILSEAKAYTNEREVVINSKIASDISVEKTARENADSDIRKDFATADEQTLTAAKGYTDSREEEIKKYVDSEISREVERSNGYADGAKSSAINAANDYTNERELIIRRAFKDSDEILKSEFETADAKLRSDLTVTSENKTIIVGAPTAKGTDLYVNIDGQTIIRDADTGQIKVASDKLVQYEGENAVRVSDVVNGNKTISLQVHANDKVLSNEPEGLFTTLSLKWVKGEVNGAKDQIQLLGKKDEIISSIDVAEFLKDGMLEDVTLNSEDVNNPKLVFVFNTSAEKQTIEVPVKDLLYVYKAGDGLSLIDSTFSIKLSDTNDSEFLTVASDGLKLSGIKGYVSEEISKIDVAYKAVDSDIFTKLTTVDATLSEHGSALSSLDNNLKGEITNRSTDVTRLQGQIDGATDRISQLESKSHEHTNKDVIDTINYERVIAWDNTEKNANLYTDNKIAVVNGDLTVDGSTNDKIFKSIIGQLVTDIAPSEAEEQTLIRKVNINGLPYFYSSNNADDMKYGTRVLSEIITEVIANNETLKQENVTLKKSNEALENEITELKAKVAELEESIKNVDFDIDADAIKEAIMADIIAEAKKAILNPDVLKFNDEAISLEFNKNNEGIVESVTFDFSDDAVFMADSIILPDIDEPIEGEDNI